VIASTTLHASALDGKRQTRFFAKGYWRKCDDTPTLSSTKAAAQVSLPGFARNEPILTKQEIVHICARLRALVDLYCQGGPPVGSEQTICCNALYENHVTVGAIFSFGLLRTNLGGDVG